MIDTVIDLSAASDLDAATLQRLLARWGHPEALGGITRFGTVLVAPGASSSPSGAVIDGWRVEETDAPIDRISRALAEAGRDGMHALLLHGQVDARCEAIGVLLQHLERDPMFGFATPRLACGEGCCIARLCRPGGRTGWLPRDILGELPEEQIVGEIASPCLLIAPPVLANFGPLDQRFESPSMAVAHYLASARRCGFRTIQSNRAVVTVDDLPCHADLAPAPAFHCSSSDNDLLCQLVPDLSRTWDESRAGSAERYERLYEAAGASRARPSVLVDMRNVVELHNGTAQAVIGMIRALRALGPNWEVEILANSNGAAFHDIEGIAADWPVHTGVPDRSFAAAIRLSQPWHIQEMLDLHRVALFNAYLMLDTIAWDVGYVAPPHLDGTWQFMADHADALLFDSEFTQQRFFQRFPTPHPVPHAVAAFSFDPDDYISHKDPQPADQEFILVVGNSLDHKDISHTVDTLSTAFPFRRIFALGARLAASPFVTSLNSGNLTEADVHSLYARASVVIFPSFYEGFGFPVVTALAYGRTVLARRSALIDELATNAVAKGSLVVYDRREDLVEIIGRITYGEAVVTEPLGATLAGRTPRSWRDVAAQIVEFVTPLIAAGPGRRWKSREHVARQLLAYRG